MELQMTAMIRVNPAAERQMQTRVNATLGEWRTYVTLPAQLAAPSPPRAATQTTDAFVVAQATVAVMQRSAEEERRQQVNLREELADAFSKGADVTARRIAEVSGDPTYKRFFRTQKGEIMGWCGAETWDQVPKFWHDIEVTKSEDDLRTILDRL